MNRRDLLLTATGLAAAHVAPAMAQPAAPALAAADGARSVGGRVHDAANGQGIGGVLVSNGRDVVVTGADGSYRIAVAPNASLSVIKPTGWMVPVQPATRLPRFAHPFIPDGSVPGVRFGGISPLDLPQAVDFALTRQDEPAVFEALLFTDPQPESMAEIGYVRDDIVAAAAAETGAKFGVTHGDLMFDDLSHYGRQNRIVGTLGLPWWNVPGNHDINVEAPDDLRSRDTFKHVFGTRTGAFQYGGVTVLLLDNVQYLGANKAKPGTLGPYRGFFGPDQIAFVRNVLAHVPAEAPVVVSFHIPLRTASGNEPAIAAVDGRALLEALSTHRNSISFSGHTHTNEHHYFGAADGFTAGGEHHHHVLAAASGSWWSGPYDVRGVPVALQSDGCPNGYHVLRAENGVLTTRFVPGHDPARALIRLMIDHEAHGTAPEVLAAQAPGATLRGPVDASSTASTRLLANLFDGGPRSSVEFRIAGRPWQPMAPTRRTDPFVEEVYARNAAVKKPWVQPTPCTHLWEAALPADLPPCMHRIEVRATDEFGQRHAAAMVLEVQAV